MHVPSLGNVQADSLSRGAAELHKWEMNWKFLAPLFYWWEHLEINVFAA